MGLINCSKCGREHEQRYPQVLICGACKTDYQRNYMRGYRAKRPGFEHARYARRIVNDPTLLDKKRKRGRDYWAELRRAAILAYGGYVCACCGEAEPKFLTLDHIFNDGNKHRKEMKGRGAAIFKWLRDHDYPAGFQVLCMNCNHGKALNGGVCPHKNNAVPKASLG